LDTHTATATWGDGAGGPASVTESGGAGTASATHAFTTVGVYTVTVAVTDDVGAPASASFQVNVQSRIPVLNPAASKDDGDFGYRERGIWQSGSASGWKGDWRQHAGAGAGSNTATWSILVSPGTYQIFATWVVDTANATNAPYTIKDNN